MPTRTTGFASPASATIVEATYTGQVTNINDVSNIFQGASVGETYVATFLYDTSLGAAAAAY